MKTLEQEYDPAYPIGELREHEDNPNQGDDALVAELIDANGFYGAIVVQKSRQRIIAGHTRWRAAKERGAETIPVVLIDVNDDEADRILLGDNRARDRASYNLDQLRAITDRLGQTERGLEGTGFSESVLDLLHGAAPLPDPNDPLPSPAGPRPSLADRFAAPPFSVLDARAGWWQDRKRRWLDMGIQSEVGRGADLIEGMTEIDSKRRATGRKGNLTFGGWDDEGDLLAAKDAKRRPESGGVLFSSLSGQVPDYYEQKRAAEARLGRTLDNAEFEADHLVVPEGGLSGSGTSVFDPVLTELSYLWFSTPGDRILDPFAGGSVRGIVAASLDRDYYGVELRAEQVAANQAQARSILEPAQPQPVWHEGDSSVVVPTLDGGFDMILSCPPYADLEVYSDDPRDISNMKYPDFLEVYREIIAASVERLALNRFIVWVIGEVRGRDGNYLGLVPDTIQAFSDAGAHLYNEAILVTPTGSLAVRVGRQFQVSRKLGKTHQNVLVFVVGDGKAATARLGDVDVPTLDAPDLDTHPTPGGTDE